RVCTARLSSGSGAAPSDNSLYTSQLATHHQCCDFHGTFLCRVTSSWDTIAGTILLTCVSRGAAAPRGDSGMPKEVRYETSGWSLGGWPWDCGRAVLRKCAGCVSKNNERDRDSIGCGA